MTINRRHLLSSTCLILTFPAAYSCKTSGSNNDTLAASKKVEALKKFISNTLNLYLPQTVEYPKPISAFAEAMVNPDTDQPETTAYLLKAYAKNGETPELAQYFLQQFLVRSNYFAILQGKAPKLLVNVTPKA